jgi:hypothetical protein
VEEDPGEADQAFARIHARTGTRSGADVGR